MNFILTNYFGTLSFYNGNPATTDTGYPYWEISILDPNDWNGNGVPDLTDPTASAPSAPLLAVAGYRNGLVITVSARVGAQVVIQGVPSLAHPAWSTVLTVTITNRAQAVVLPVPGGNQFWRAVEFY